MLKKRIFSAEKKRAPDSKKLAALLALAALLLVGAGFLIYQQRRACDALETLLAARDAELKETGSRLRAVRDQFQKMRFLAEGDAAEYDELRAENNNFRDEITALRLQLAKYEEGKAARSEQSGNPAEKGGVLANEDEMDYEKEAPGYKRCLADAKTDAEIRKCKSASLTYWDNRLNVVYKKALARCAGDANPIECRASLKKMEFNWMVFHDMMGDMLYFSGKRAGARMDYLDFMAGETKRQCLRLEYLSDYKD